MSIPEPSVRGGASAEAVRAKLEARTRALAQVPRRETDEVSLELLVFTLAAETYAVETRFVREVARFGEFASVPLAAETLIGVTNLRGEVLPVFDLRPLLGVPRNRLTDLVRAIVLERRGDAFAVLADQAVDVERVPRSAILPGSALPPGTEREIVLGVTAQAVIVLDGEALLRDARFGRGPKEEV